VTPMLRRLVVVELTVSSHRGSASALAGEKEEREWERGRLVSGVGAGEVGRLALLGRAGGWAACASVGAASAGRARALQAGPREKERK
jgi:hypothetical protein